MWREYKWNRIHCCVEEVAGRGLWMSENTSIHHFWHKNCKGLNHGCRWWVQKEQEVILQKMCSCGARLSCHCRTCCMLRVYVASEKEIKGVNNGKKIHQNLLLQFCKTLSWKLLEVEGLFQGNNTLYFSWFYPLPSVSALSQYRRQDWHCSHLLLNPFYRDKFNLHQGSCYNLPRSLLTKTFIYANIGNQTNKETERKTKWVYQETNQCCKELLCSRS